MFGLALVVSEESSFGTWGKIDKLSCGCNRFGTHQNIAMAARIKAMLIFLYILFARRGAAGSPGFAFASRGWRSVVVASFGLVRTTALSSCHRGRVTVFEQQYLPPPSPCRLFAVFLLLGLQTLWVIPLLLIFCEIRVVVIALRKSEGTVSIFAVLHWQNIDGTMLLRQVPLFWFWFLYIATKKKRQGNKKRRKERWHVWESVFSFLPWPSLLLRLILINNASVGDFLRKRMCCQSAVKGITNAIWGSSWRQRFYLFPPLSLLALASDFDWRCQQRIFSQKKGVSLSCGQGNHKCCWGE